MDIGHFAFVKAFGQKIPDTFISQESDHAILATGHPDCSTGIYKTLKTADA
jgi:hypothetical protein